MLSHLSSSPISHPPFILCTGLSQEEKTNVRLLPHSIVTSVSSLKFIKMYRELQARSLLAPTQFYGSQNAKRKAARERNDDDNDDDDDLDNDGDINNASGKAIGKGKGKSQSKGSRGRGRGKKGG